MIKWIVVASLCSGAAVLACSHDNSTENINCQPIVNGVAIYTPGIDLQIRDPFGHGQAMGTTAVIQRSDGAVDPSYASDTVNLVDRDNMTGTFNVTLRRPYYLETTINGIRVTPEGCGVHGITVPVTMQLAPGAPALRSIVLLGQQLLGGAGSQAHLVAYFDANPDVTRDLTWQVSDTTLASVDSNGVVSWKCTKNGGTVTVTATSVYDGHTSGSVQIGIWPATSCP